ncbi:hypothetical protein BDR26DRAFT_859608 [Obelidium mucronatum]|nr:hypothetical protein BDR26DRAFT_859608 [Obelidium mucronatum]
MVCIQTLPPPVIYELVETVFKRDIMTALSFFQSCSIVRAFGFKLMFKLLLSHLPNGVQDVQRTLTRGLKAQWDQFDASLSLEWKAGSLITRILNQHFVVYRRFCLWNRDLASTLTDAGLVPWNLFLSEASKEFDSVAARIEKLNTLCENSHIILLPLDFALLSRWLLPIMNRQGLATFFKSSESLSECRLGLDSTDEFQLATVSVDEPEPNPGGFIGIINGKDQEIYLKVGWDIGFDANSSLYMNVTPRKTIGGKFGSVEFMEGDYGWCDLDDYYGFDSMTHVLVDMLDHEVMEMHDEWPHGESHRVACIWSRRDY